MEDMIVKVFASEASNADIKTGEVDVFIPLSTESVDRDGEVVLANAFKKHLGTFKKRPILVSSHEYRDLRKQIGEFTNVKVGEDGLYGKPRYYINQGNEEADWGFFLASNNKAAFSIGFIPVAWQDNPEGDGWKTPRKTFTEVELLEVSHVIVPSNRGAAQAMKEDLRMKGIEPPENYRKAIEQVITKPETTEDYFRVPVPGEAGKHDGHRIRTIDISQEKGIKALYCGECKIVITYLFSRDEKYNWTMARAEAWVREHSRDFNPENLESKTLALNATLEKGEPPRGKELTWNEIKDEFEYIKTICNTHKGNVEIHRCIWDLVEVILGDHGGHMPFDIEAKIGAVLNAKNKERLKSAQALIQGVLDSAEAEPQQDMVTSISEEKVAAMVLEALGRHVKLNGG